MMYVRFEDPRTGMGLFGALYRYESRRSTVHRRVRFRLDPLRDRLFTMTPAAPAWAYDPPGRPGRARTWWLGEAAQHIGWSLAAANALQSAGFCVRRFVAEEEPGGILWSDSVQAVILEEPPRLRRSPGERRARERRIRWSGDRRTIRMAGPIHAPGGPTGDGVDLGVVLASPAFGERERRARW